MSSNYSKYLKDPRWQRKRLEIMNRDNFTCQLCKDTHTTLNVHHTKYDGMPWDIANELLITLCEDCHSITHEMHDVKIVKVIKKMSESDGCYYYIVYSDFGVHFMSQYPAEPVVLIVTIKHDTLELINAQNPNNK